MRIREIRSLVYKRQSQSFTFVIMKERIEEILLKYLLSSAQFADMIGVQRSSISHILSGRNKPSFDFIEKILIKYPEINADWLITGRGTLNNQLNSSYDDQESPKEPDLFKQNPNNQHLTPKTKPLISKHEPMNKEEIPIGDIVKEVEVTNVNSVKSIIFVYNDDSFKIINSR